MRCTILAARREDGSGWTLDVSCAGLADFPALELTLPPTTASATLFPLPHDPDGEVWADTPQRQLWAEADGKTGKRLADAHHKILQNSANRETIDAFGRYLTSLLFGGRWSTLDEKVPAGEPLEIDLHITADDSVLLRLPWEMMHGDKGALAAHAARKIALTRIVAPKKAVADIPDQRRPLRILFVIGRQIDQERMRAGAEFLGLLRQLRVPTNTTLTSFQNADVLVQHLDETTPDELQTAVREFQPSVVHFICHGQVISKKVHILLTKRAEEGNVKARKSTDPHPCSAKELLALLRDANGALPPVVVLNACRTADAVSRVEEASSALSFAAQLVEGDEFGGVAMAVGMAGEVDDRACQVFTLRFYQAIIDKQSVSMATAQGRRGALLEYPELQNSIEWIRPTLFRADGVASALPMQAPTRNLGAVARQYRKEGTFGPLLCDRFDLLSAAQDFLKRAAQSKDDDTLVLPFRVSHPAGGVGKTRLLEEIAGLSVHLGFLPIILRNRKGCEPPKNFVELAIQIAAAADEARTNFKAAAQAAGAEPAAGADSLRVAAAYRLAVPLGTVLPDVVNPVTYSQLMRQLPEFLEQSRKLNAATTFATVRPTILDDCASAMHDVRKSPDERYRVLLLIDDLHRYAGLAGELIDEGRVWGLGTPELPLPFIFTFMTNTDEGQSIDAKLKQRKVDIGDPHEIRPFETTFERRLASKQILLGEWQCVPTSSPNERGRVEKLLGLIEQHTEGRPKEFNSDSVRAYVRTGREFDVFVDARFEDMLKKWP